MAKTKFFRVAVEGATLDGRVIERAWIEQMAASYDPATYTARINCEHIAGYSPDRPFNAYGSVLSLKAEDVELTINGEKKTLLALYAEIDANDQLVEINKAGQKLFTSCEIHPNFAGEGKAYLVGLAVTDQPASLGTEALKFAVMSRPNLFTSAHETTIEILPSTDGADIASAVIVEEIATAALKAQGAGASFPLDILYPLSDLTAGLDIHDEVRAKLLKAIGVEQLSEAEDLPADDGFNALTAAVSTLNEAQRLHERVGVKDKIKRGLKLMAAITAAREKAIAEQNNEQGGPDQNGSAA